jgi:uncharacterized protein YndB with AHSA1/START domain
MHHDATPVVKADMLIRRPVSEVFRAFVDPAITARFWFTHSSGPLTPGSRVRWSWQMYDASTEVRVLALEPDRRILIEWDEPPTRVEWLFTVRPDHTTTSVYPITASPVLRLRSFNRRSTLWAASLSCSLR